MTSNRKWRRDAALPVTTRRGVLKLGSGAALAVFIGAGDGGAVLGEEASPVASPTGDSLSLTGNQVVIRMRTVKPDHSNDELLTLIQEGFVPLLAEIPGFVAYIAAADPETRVQFSVGIFADEAGVAESHRRAAEWGALGAADFVEGDPTVFEGPIGVAAAPAPHDELVGKYALIRLRKPNPEWTVEEVMARIDEGYVPLVEAIPGFMSYFGSADPESGSQAYVAIFADRTGADESTRLAREWLMENGYDFFAGDPVVSEGAIGAAGTRY